MKALVTGATGFIGSHLVKGLVHAGHDVVVTYRSDSKLKALEGVDVKAIKADVCDLGSMRKAVKGCDALFHVAGIVASQPKDLVWRINALTPEVACEAAVALGVSRVVVTSSVAGLGPARKGAVGDESMTYRTGHRGMTYVDSKHEGESRALAAGARLGLEVVVVNPSYVLGPDDPTGTSTRIVCNYLRGRLPAVVDGLTNIVDIGDVVDGHMLAYGRGRPGERYVLGGHNVHWAEVVARLVKITGVHYPVLVLPPESAAIARLRESIGLYMPVSAEGLELMRQNWSYSSAKAKRELGYKVTSINKTLEATASWCLKEIEQGRFGRHDRSALRLLARAAQMADSAGALKALNAGGRLIGRKLVV